ncbi:hypothetical protein SKA53_07986 [Yoonia vestfoldensis SKA53]|uniref:Uncharacterized protein n=1 Tax=Yoonia vestfoldensis SKA53 TaxID=314232 RepID=A3V713_9RHOB|nr:hypothetical protein SKA53_07986 [Yoonia vestfoldensis SKA53]
MIVTPPKARCQTQSENVILFLRLWSGSISCA